MGPATAVGINVNCRFWAMRIKSTLMPLMENWKFIFVFFFLALWFVLLFAIPVSSKNPTTMAPRIIVFEYHRHAISKITRPGPSC